MKTNAAYLLSISVVFVLLYPPYAAANQIPTQLLSISDISLHSNEYLVDFKIKTLGVRILAVCHRPAAWMLKAGSYDETEGELSGEGGVAPAHLTNHDLTVLNNLYLVQIEKTDNKKIPSFEGEASAMTFADNQGEQQIRKITLTSHNILLHRAKKCLAPSGNQTPTP